MRIPTKLQRLWNLTEGDPSKSEYDWNDTFDPVGLILYAPPRNIGYWCTPSNSVTFATTGGDGVHYGWVDIPNTSIDLCPIVMTVPMSDSPNLIVGANMQEFLGLGCRFGYFQLEGLVYDYANTIAELSRNRFDQEADQSEVALLTRLSQQLNLEPWGQPGNRLATLQELYLSKLVVPDATDA